MWSLLLRKPGDRIKTDRRAAINLAKLRRAGELTPVWVPNQAHEAIRDLVRARQAAVRTVRQARQQLSGFLLRHGHHYNRPAWTLMHRRCLSGLQFEHAVHYIVLEDCIAAVEAATARRDRLEAHIEAALRIGRWRRWCARCRRCAAWRWWSRDADRRTRRHHPLRQSPSAHGVSRPGAIRTLERQHATPGRHHQDGQQCGTADVDRGRVELSVPGQDQPGATVAPGSAGQADPGHGMEGTGAAVSASSHARPSGKATTVVTAAIARELSGFVWAIAKQVQRAGA